MLSSHKKLAASVMRRAPVSVRKVRYWRDHLYQALGAGGWDDNDAIDSRWPSELQVVRGRNGMLMELDLTDWCQRRSYFTGRFYQEDLEDLLSCLLAPGDTFVDVGANIGLVTLHAASVIGPSGALWAFEPNPEVYTRLIRHLEMNNLDCRAMNIGLGSRDDTLTMSLFGRHTGKATLVNRGTALKTVEVPVRRGDAILTIDKPTVIKIDVEGFEVSVLEGLDAVLDGNVAVAIEVSRPWLQAAGTSVAKLHDVLLSHGLKPYRFELVENRLGRKLVVEPLPGPLDAEQYDCLFMRQDSVFAGRV